jgi:hypothetical protein
VVDPAAAAAIIQAEGGATLERILNAYKAVPDPKVPGQLLYDQSMCEKVYATLQELITLGYQPKAVVTLDSPDADEAPVPPTATAPGGAGATPAKSAGAAALASDGGNDDNNAGKSMLAELRGNGRTVEVWTDGKPRKAKITVSGDAATGTIRVQFEDQEKKTASNEMKISTNTVKVVRENCPQGFKKKTFGRNPKPEASIALENLEGKALLHIEVMENTKRHNLAMAFGLLASVALKT